jgi:ABC-type nitrate/sulfonate/bicarbonate transport system substrate-binding protein
MRIPFRVALLGIFQDPGLRGADPPRAIGHRRACFGESTSPPSAASCSRARVDLSIIGCTSYDNYILLGNKQTRTVEDLKGKVIGVTGAGTYSEFAMKAFLKKFNINPDRDVTLRAIGGTVLRAAAIEKGLIAAAPFSPSQGS